LYALCYTKADEVADDVLDAQSEEPRFALGKRIFILDVSWNNLNY